jgi:hypothetical protein
MLQDSLDYFGDRRTDLDHGKTFQGVETPSQVGPLTFPDTSHVQ